MAKFTINTPVGLTGNAEILKIEEIENKTYYEVIINGDPRIVKLPEEVLYRLPLPKDFCEHQGELKNGICLECGKEI